MGVGVNGGGDLDVGLCRCGSCTAAASTASWVFWLLASGLVQRRLPTIANFNGNAQNGISISIAIAISRCNGQRTSRHLWGLVIVCVLRSVYGQLSEYEKHDAALLGVYSIIFLCRPVLPPIVG